MATKKKLLQAAAGGAGGAGGAALNVEDVFSTYLYDGNGSSQTIQNGINLGQAFGSGSARFGGTATGEYLQTPVSSDFDLGNGDFTIEFFMNVTNADGNNQEVFSFGDGTGDFDFLIYLSGGQVQVYMSSNGTSWDILGGNTAGNFTLSKWHHVAITRSSAGIRGFVDGVQGFGAGNTSIVHQSANQITIGRGQDGKRFNGYLSDFHFIKGTEKYSSGFTPTTSAITVDANTKLLTLQQDSLLTDNSTTGHTITEYAGSIYDEPVFGPFDAAEAGEGGLVWTKSRSAGDNHRLADTERGAGNGLFTDLTNAESSTATCGVDAFYSDGYLSDYSDSYFNGVDIASWTFRKAPKFFDVVTYTGDGVAGRTISHNLGTTVGSIFVKRTDAGWGWQVYHRGLSNPATKMLQLHNSEPEITGFWYGTAATSTEFTVNDSNSINQSGGTYVAYLFAHNDGDGGFNGGDIIKCGSYTGTGSAGNEIDLGFEPQWLLVKNANEISNWNIYDVMRGMTVGGTDYQLEPNTSDAELGYSNWFDITPNGFTVQTGAAAINGSGDTIIYMAIRRGTKVPESGTEVFDIADMSSFQPTHIVDITPDAALLPWRTTSYDDGTNSYPEMFDRLRGNGGLQTSNDRAENTGRAGAWDYMDRFTGVYSTGAWMWKRAPGYFDVVAYSGNGTAGRTVSHNLGVAPEMMWVKGRDVVDHWHVYHTATTADNYLRLNDTGSSTDSVTIWNDTDPTDSVFTLGNNGGVNGSGDNYIAYLFATLDGVSKVGSYTGNGSSQTIDCGFTSGARFILVKRTDSTGDWYVWDTERGIVAGNDPYLELNTTDAEVTNTDWVDPDNSGFIVNGTTINASSAEYIFYAIA